MNLRVLFLEAEGDLDAAEELIDSILKENPTNKFCLKRLSAIRRSLGDISGAIRKLNEYLELYAADSESYLELADLYLQAHEFRKAAFCFEEMILTNPYSHVFHSRYAEALYTIGDFRLARKHFSRSLELNHENNARALWGLIMTVLSIRERERNPDTDNAKLFSWAEHKLLQHYEHHCSDDKTLSAIVRKVLEQESAAVTSTTAATSSTKSSAQPPSSKESNKPKKRGN